MRLVDLGPRWLIKDGQRVGFIFRSPTRPSCWQSCFAETPPKREQWALFAEALGGDEDDRECGRPDVQGCSQGTRWSFTPPIAVADFANLTITPSLDGSAGGNWHGFITAGDIVGGL